MLYTPSVLEAANLPRILARQWWSEARLRAWQERRLLGLVAHAWEKVPFYRERWKEAGVSPKDIRSLADLSALPVIPSSELKAAPREMLLARDVDPQRCRIVYTSGTTGHPLGVTYTRSDHFTLIKAMSVRYYLAHGVGVRDHLAGFVAHADACHAPPGWYERLGFWRRLRLLVTDDARNWVKALSDSDVSVMAGSPMTLVELVETARQCGANVAPNTKLLFSSGCKLEREHRRLLESAFPLARVVDVYGCNEGGMLAWQCPRCAGYHVNADTVILEVLDGDKPAAPGQPGEVVITNLFSSAMPFIRYKAGDMVSLSPEPALCGRALPLLQAVWGRSEDCLRLPSRRKVNYYPIYMILLEEENAFGQWRVVQESDGSCVLQVVPRQLERVLERKEPLQRALADVVGHEVPFRMELVERIERDPKTKWKTIVSRVGAKK